MVHLLTISVMCVEQLEEKFLFSREMPPTSPAGWMSDSLRVNSDMLFLLTSANYR